MNEELVGYRGEQIVDAGYFYAPYIPLTTTPVVTLNPEIYDATEADWKREGF